MPLPTISQPCKSQKLGETEAALLESIRLRDIRVIQPKGSLAGGGSSSRQDRLEGNSYAKKTLFSEALKTLKTDTSNESLKHPQNIKNFLN